MCLLTCLCRAIYRCNVGRNGRNFCSNALPHFFFSLLSLIFQSNKLDHFASINKTWRKRLYSPPWDKDVGIWKPHFLQVTHTPSCTHLPTLGQALVCVCVCELGRVWHFQGNKIFKLPSLSQSRWIMSQYVFHFTKIIIFHK